MASIAIDCLSTLPEALIIHILSLLPTLRDKIRTGVLSRKWQYLWTHVQQLYFDYQGEGFSKVGDFVNCVNKTLILCTGSNVKFFGVKMLNFTSTYHSDFEAWTRFAATRQIEKFELVFTPTGVLEHYVLPQHLYTSSAFRDLRLCFCDFANAGLVSWNSLKKLSISRCRFSNESLEKILAGTPALQFLDLTLLRGVYHLNFGKSGLKKLVVRIGRVGLDEIVEGELEISAPTVQSLEVSGYFRICKLVDMTSLVEATLYGVRQLGPTLYPVLTQQVLNSLMNVKTLTLGNWVTQGIAVLRAEGVHPSLPNCKCLTVDTTMWETNPSAIAGLLKSCPGIETLIITLTNNSIFEYNCFDRHCFNTDEYWTSQEEASSHFMHLRTVKFVRFGIYRKFAFSFVQFLLKNAKVLRKMIIYLEIKDWSKDRSRRELFETSRKLLSFPRYSRCAEFFVYE